MFRREPTTRGKGTPMNAVRPKQGQESVWDYPRPPRLERCQNTTIKIVSCEKTIVDSDSAWRMLETSHPPVYYLPVSAVTNATLRENRHQSWCEWKGRASYFDLVIDGEVIENAGWFYPEPAEKYVDLRRTVAFYPSKMDACYVGDERVVCQEGDFYGGWITSQIVGPFKGGPGTRGW